MSTSLTFGSLARAHWNRRQEARFNGRSGRAAFVACVLFVVSGCATIKPYERERLSRADMQLAGEGNASAGEDHARSYREGASGALGASGGGCGCN